MEEIFIILACRRAGKMYLYSITKNIPTDIETP